MIAAERAVELIHRAVAEWVRAGSPPDLPLIPIGGEPTRFLITGRVTGGIEDGAPEASAEIQFVAYPRGPNLGRGFRVSVSFKTAKIGKHAALLRTWQTRTLDGEHFGVGINDLCDPPVDVNFEEAPERWIMVLLRARFADSGDARALFSDLAAMSPWLDLAVGASEDAFTDVSPQNQQVGVSARSDHYLVAHMWLRELALESPGEVAGMLSGDLRRTLLGRLWASAHELVTKRGEPRTDPGRQVFRYGTIFDAPFVAVSMPVTVAMTEAAWVLLVLDANPTPNGEAPYLGSYFTLERSIGSSVLGEWRAGSHANLGDLEHEELACLLQAVGRRRAPPEAVDTGAQIDRYGYERLIRQIANHELELADVPAPDANWKEIRRFARTAGALALENSEQTVEEIAGARPHNDLADLRVCLYFEEQRWRELAREPDVESMAHIREVVERIRSCCERGEHRKGGPSV